MYEQALFNIYTCTQTHECIYIQQREFLFTHRELYFNCIMNISYNIRNQVSTVMLIYCYTLVSQLQFGLLGLTLCTQLQKPRQEDTRVLSE